MLNKEILDNPNLVPVSITILKETTDPFMESVTISRNRKAIFDFSKDIVSQVQKELEKDARLFGKVDVILSKFNKDYLRDTSENHELAFQKFIQSEVYVNEYSFYVECDIRASLMQEAEVIE